jgi:hypothetical protein
MFPMLVMDMKISKASLTKVHVYQPLFSTLCIIIPFYFLIFFALLLPTFFDVQNNHYEAFPI